MQNTSIRRIVPAALAVMALCLATVLVAKPERGPGGGPGGHFKKMDTDGNGQISRAEWDTFHATMFGQIDANKDGALNSDEMRKHHETMGPGKGNGKKEERRRKHQGDEACCEVEK